MANFGYISMAPAIAEVADQITAVDGIVDDILVDTNETIPLAIAGVNTIVTQSGLILIDFNENVLPALAAEHMVIDGIVENILVDTGATIPAAITAKAIRGEFKEEVYDAVPGDIVYHDVLNISGSSGVLCYIIAWMATTNGKIRLTLDSKTAGELMIVAGSFKFITISETASGFILIVSDTRAELMFEFKSTLLVEARQTDGANRINCNVYYQDDS